MAETAAAPAPAAATATPADPKAPPAAPAAAAEPTQEFIVNGKPVKLTAAQVKVAVQKGIFAEQKLQSVTALKTSSEKLVNALKTPEGVLGLLQDKSLGNSPKAVLKALLSSNLIDDESKEELSQWVYQNVVKKAQLTPEQLDQEKRLSRLDQLEKQEAARKQQELTQKQQGEIQQVYAAVRAEVTNAIVADKTFPKTEPAIRMVIEKLRVMNKKGAPINAESVKKAMGLVKSDFLAHQQAFLDADDDAEALIQRIGEPRALKISKALIARLKNKQSAKTEVKPAAEGSAREKVTDRIDRKLGKTPHGYHVLDI